MKNKRILFLIVGLAVASLMVVFTYNTLYPDQRNIADETAVLDISAQDFLKKMGNAEIAKNYGDKVIQTYGKITSIDARTITLDNAILVNLLNTSNLELSNGDSITIKGRCIGYDDLLEEVKIDQASIVQNKNSQLNNHMK